MTIIERGDEAQDLVEWMKERTVEMVIGILNDDMEQVSEVIAQVTKRIGEQFAEEHFITTTIRAIRAKKLFAKQSL